jgi:DNA-binding transcriptional ArsR family regulator
VSVHVSSWAWKQTTGDHGTKLVLLKLTDNANDAGECWPSQRRLAAECEMSRATVQRKLDKLEELGLVEVSLRKRDNGSQTSNLYRILMPTVPHDEAGVARSGEAGGARPGEAPNEPSLEPSIESPYVDEAEFFEQLDRVPLTDTQRRRATRSDDRPRVKAWLDAYANPPAGINNRVGWFVAGVEGNSWPQVDRVTPAENASRNAVAWVEKSGCLLAEEQFEDILSERYAPHGVDLDEIRAIRREVLREPVAA